YEALLRVVAESERTLAGFYNLSGERRTHVSSETVLRHWVATVKRMECLVTENPGNSDAVLKKLCSDRYELGLARLSRLIGDNPVTIDRTPSKYTYKRRRHLLSYHIEDLIKQTEQENMHPKITKADLKEIFRFAGNASFITEHDEVIEFREKEKRYLCKYLLKDQILIVIDDLWFLNGNAAKASDKIPVAKLVTIYPKELAAKQLTKDLATKGRYLPNCVHLPELVNFLNDVDAKSAAAAATELEHKRR
ncbi:MAG: hypothetical protein ACRECH_18380, partial [Nitrososphaerales archaeon]